MPEEINRIPVDATQNTPTVLVDPLLDQDHSVESVDLSGVKFLQYQLGSNLPYYVMSLELSAKDTNRDKHDQYAEFGSQDSYELPQDQFEELLHKVAEDPELQTALISVIGRMNRLAERPIFNPEVVPILAKKFAKESPDGLLKQYESGRDGENGFFYAIGDNRAITETLSEAIRNIQDPRILFRFVFSENTFCLPKDLVVATIQEKLTEQPNLIDGLDGNMLFWQIREGYMSPELVATTLAKRMSEDYHYASKIVASRELSYLSKELTPELRRKIVDGIKDSVRIDYRFARYENSTFLTTDEKREIKRAAIERDEHPVLSFHIMEEVLSPDEIRDIVLNKDTGMLSHFDSTPVFMSDYFSRSEKQALVESTILSNPRLLCVAPEFYLGFFPAEKRSELVRRALMGTTIAPDGTSVYSVIGELLPYISLYPQEQRQFLLEQIDSARNLNFLETYLLSNDYSGSELLRSLLSRDDVRQIIKNTTGKMLIINYDKARNFFDADELQDMVREVAHENMFAYLIAYNEGSVPPFSLEENMEFATKASEKAQGFEGIYSALGEATKLCGKDFVKQLVEDNCEEYASTILLEGLHLVRRIFADDKDYIELISKKIITANPILAIQYGVDGFTREQITEIGRQDERRDMAPKNLDSFYKKFETASQGQRQALYRDGISVYDAIISIRSSGIEDEYRRLQENVKSEKDELELLNVFDGLARFKKSHPEIFTEIEGKFNTVESARLLLLQAFGKALDINHSLDEAQVAKFMDSMKDPVPFIIYTLTYEDSEPHRQLLSSMFDSLLQGKFSDWKFGQPTSENVENLKSKRLLPQNLAVEQFEEWIKDERQSYFEYLSSDSFDVANQVKSYLLENADHLPLEVLMEFNISGPISGAVGEVGDHLAVVGQEFAAINKKINELKKSGENPDALEEAMKERGIKEIQRNKLVVAKNVLRLMNLKPEEVSSGFFIEGNNKTLEIRKVLSQLNREVGQDNLFVIDNVGNLLKGINEDLSAENLVAQDESNPKVLLEIGSNPVGSCQHYGHGSENECLVAYVADPNTKVITVKKDNGSMVARSVLRLLEDTDGRSALHLERIYSSMPGKNVNKAALALALKKASMLGVPLYESVFNQDEIDEMRGTELPDGFEIIDSATTLISQGSRAPAVYVDSAGGEERNGRYMLSNLAEVRHVERS